MGYFRSPFIFSLTSKLMEWLSKEEERVLLKKSISRLTADPRLTEWERGFLHSIGRQLARGNLTEKQAIAMRKITRKYS